MEGNLAEIRCFAGNFAPRTWAFCNGQQMAINTNQALFSLLGTVYGGNGVSTFALPNMQSRTPVGVGNGGLGSVVLAQVGGVENYTLLTNDMPQHTHVPTVTAGTSPASGTLTLNGTGVPATGASPANNLLAADDGGLALDIYGPAASPVVAMSPKAITFSGTIGAPTLQVGANGGNQPHNNIQPSLGINFIICLQGIFPSRN